MAVRLNPPIACRRQPCTWVPTQRTSATAPNCRPAAHHVAPRPPGVGEGSHCGRTRLLEDSVGGHNCSGRTGCLGAARQPRVPTETPREADTRARPMRRDRASRPPTAPPLLPRPQARIAAWRLSRSSWASSHQHHPLSSSAAPSSSPARTTWRASPVSVGPASSAPRVLLHRRPPKTSSWPAELVRLGVASSASPLTS